MADLSPQAQAVLDAFMGNGTIHGVHLIIPRFEVHESDRHAVAAALCAAADQVVPEDLPTFADGGRSSEEQWMARVESSVRQQLLAIAAELKGKGND